MLAIGGCKLEVPRVLSRLLLRRRVFGVGVHTLPPGMHRDGAGLLLLRAYASRGVTLRRIRIRRWGERNCRLQIFCFAQGDMVVRSSSKRVLDARRLRELS